MMKVTADSIRNNHTGTALTLLVLTMIAGLLLAVLLTATITAFAGLDETAAIRCSIVLQNLLAFIVPAIFMPVMVYGKKSLALSFGSKPRPSAFLWIILIYAVATPAINYAVDWNESLTLPDSMSSIEQWMKASEESAKAVTNKLLDADTVGGLVMNIVCMGILTGIGEELFFRGALQNVLSGFFRSKHAAVWVSAIVFSAFHLQFYGFVPRMIMGAIFGYALLWTGSVWVSATVHALNNISVVVIAYLANSGIADDSLTTIGAEDGFPLTAMMSAVLTILLMTAFHHFLNHNQQNGKYSNN